MTKNDSIIAQQIISLKTTNLKDQMFHTHSPIYVKSNERIEAYTNYFKDKENVLSVIASGDQILNMIYYGAKKIDAFDISTFPQYYTYLKIGAIKSLTLKEYLNFFYQINEDSEKYDDMYYYKIRENLNEFVREFWDDLFNFFDWKDINESTLFSKETISLSDVINQNIFLQNKTNYKSLQNKIDNVAINPSVINIINEYYNYNKPYDLVYLSNLIYYINIYKYKQIIDSFNLKDNGIVLTYLYDSLPQIKDFFNEQQYQVESIKDTQSGILIRKKI